MKHLWLFCVLVGTSITMHAVNKIVRKPFIEGRGMKGWLIDSIQINDTATIAYGQFGLGKGWTASGNLDNYIEIPATGKKYKQTQLKGLPTYPNSIEGNGQPIHFEFVFPPIAPGTRVINITNKDFDGKDAAWYGIWLEPKTSVYTQALKELPTLQGNWFKTDGTGDWMAGFYEKKIFWQNKFWNFRVVQALNKTATLALISAAGQTKTIHLAINNDKLIISHNNKKLTLARKPVYEIADQATFNKSYLPNDSLTVSGYYQVANPIFSAQAALIVPDPISIKPNIYLIKVAKGGTFKVKIPFCNTAKVVFSNQLGPRSPLSEVSFMAEPGNHIILTYRNEDEKGVVFNGDNQRFNNEMQVFSAANPYFVSDRKISDDAPNNLSAFTQWRKRMQDNMKTGWTSWQSTHPANAKLESQMSLYLKYALPCDMIKAANYNPRQDFNRDFLPTASDTAFYNNTAAIASVEYLNMLSGLKTLSQQQIAKVTPKNIAEYLQKNAKPTPTEIELLIKLDELDNATHNKESINTYRSFVTEHKSTLEAIFKTYAPEINAFRASIMEEAEKQYALPQQGFAKDLSIARDFGNMLSKEETTLRPDHLDLLKTNCKNAELVQRVLKRNEEVGKLLDKIKNSKLPQGVNTYTLPETTSDLTTAILEKYKGKVVYIDFWATWCGPCRGELPYSEKRKEDFKGKDVVFLYITGASSPEIIWKKMISSIPGEHYKLSEQQWKNICDKYQINGIPHYMLVNKDGQIVIENAPRPSDAGALSSEIKKLL